MDTAPFVVETDPSFDDVRFLEDRLYAYNVEQTGVDGGQWLAIFLRDDQQTIQAGLMRGQGVGTQLLHAAEQEARAHGCDHMVLSSFSFQAPGFYQKLGYEVFAVLDEHPRAHRAYSLHKWLR